MKLRYLPRATLRPVARKPGTNIPAVSIGARIGYWPCLKAPFIQVSLALWHIELWVGYPSLKQIESGDA